MDDLVQRLSSGPQPVIVGGPCLSARDLGTRLTDIGYVFIKFTETKGGTDLNLRVDPAATRLDEADFTAGTGRIHIEGTLALNFIPVRCVADIDVASLSGLGWLLAEMSESPA
ncbi:hypothetical protein D3C76_198800 [compost metagenome]